MTSDGSHSVAHLWATDKSQDKSQYMYFSKAIIFMYPFIISGNRDGGQKADFEVILPASCQQRGEQSDKDPS